MMLKLSVLLCLLEAVAGYWIQLGRYKYSTESPGGSFFDTVPHPCPTDYIVLTPRHQGMCSRDEDLHSSPHIDCRFSTYIFIPGIQQSVNEPWVRQMYEMILENEQANCIVMNWESCAWQPYFQQVQNVDVLAHDLHDFMKSLQKQGCDPAKITLIANDLSAYIAGRAGSLTRDLGTIIAMNPAKPIFEDQASRYLNTQCANFVQVLHTSAQPYDQFGFGVVDPMGHMDCYINKGMDVMNCPDLNMTAKEAFCMVKPTLGPMGCSDWDFVYPDNCSQILGDKVYTVEEIGGLDYNIYCSHFQALNHYMQSGREPQLYLGHECATVEDCMAGNVMPCPNGVCTPLGYFAKNPNRGDGKSALYYVEVSATPILGSG